VKDATATVKAKLPEGMDRLNSVLKRTDDAIARASGSLEDIKKAVADVREVSASAKGVVVNNRGKLDAMIAALKATGDNLKAASSEIRRSPWRLLYKPGKGEMANLNLYDSARQFAEGANDMSDAATALRDALASKDVDGKQLKVLVDRLDRSFEGFKQVETALWEKVQVRE